MVILEFMDMKSTKFGGLGRFMIRLMKGMAGDEFHFVFQNQPSSQEMIAAFEQLGAKIHVINTEGKQAIKKIPEVIRLFRKIRPDVIHFHFANSFFLYAPIAKMLGIKRLFKTQHCCLTTDDLRQITHKHEFNLKTRIVSLDGKIYKLFDKIIMSGKYVGLQFANIYGQSDKYEMIYFGVECTALLPMEQQLLLKEKLGINKDDIVIVTTAFADSIKGIDVLIKSISHIKLQNFVILLLGLDEKLPLTKEYCQLAHDLNVSQRIRWIGITNQVGDYLSIADIYCQPSRSEALPLAAIEAKSAHLPVVGSNVGGLPEVSNITFDNGDPLSLAESLELLIDNPALRHSLSEKSFLDFKKCFDIQKGVEAYRNLYRK